MQLWQPKLRLSKESTSVALINPQHNLGYNQIKDKGVEYLCELLAEKSDLTAISLGTTIITESSYRKQRLDYAISRNA